MRLGIALSPNTRFSRDNQGAIKLAQNPGSSRRTRHIDIRFHFTREAIEEGVVELVYCNTAEMTADLLTKPIPRQQFEKLRQKLGMDIVA